MAEPNGDGILIKRAVPNAKGISASYKIDPNKRNPYYSTKEDTTIVFGSLVDRDVTDEEA